MSEQLRVAVVGVGYLGRFHALIYSRMEGVDLVGVVDADPQVALRVADECDCSVIDRAGDLLGRVDALSVVVPTTAHLEVARPFLEQGVHLLVEKPIAATVSEAREILALAERSGSVVQVGHLERFNAGVMALAERISRPRFVEAHRMGSFVARATDVDVVSDLMIHDIDIILSLVKAEISSIAAVGTPVLTQHIDIANARIEFDNGTVANVIASRVSDRKSRRIRVFEQDRYEALDFIEQRLDTAYTRPCADSEWPEIVREQVRVEPVKPLDTELADFVRCLRTGDRPLVDGQAGLRALDVALQVKEKILTRGLTETQHA
jgi:predicted dehydrogenase